MRAFTGHFPHSFYYIVLIQLSKLVRLASKDTHDRAHLRRHEVRGGVGGGSTSYKHGGLTPDGIELLSQMAELGFIWDISHLAEEGVWQGMDHGFPRVCASHPNARALTSTHRHLSDEVIRAGRWITSPVDGIFIKP